MIYVDRLDPIILDGRIVSNPTIDYNENPNGISGGRAQITGPFSQSEAQTLANTYLALESGLEIVAALNKIDLPAADPDRYAAEIEQVLGIPAEEILPISAKTGQGVEDLLKAVWPDAIVSPKGLKAFVRRLRHVLHDRADRPRFIETVHGQGYRFIGEVVRSKEETRDWRLEASAPSN